MGKAHAIYGMELTHVVKILQYPSQSMALHTEHPIRRMPLLLKPELLLIIVLNKNTEGNRIHNISS